MKTAAAHPARSVKLIEVVFPTPDTKVHRSRKQERSALSTPTKTITTTAIVFINLAIFRKRYSKMIMLSQQDCIENVTLCGIGQELGWDALSGIRVRNRTNPRPSRSRKSLVIFEFVRTDTVGRME